MTTPTTTTIALDSDCKRCRRCGEKLFLKGERCNSPKCAMVKRDAPPGQHGEKGRGKLSGYGQQLMQKQKARSMYGIMERQFHGYYEKALKKIGNTKEFLFIMLERRLDNVVYRIGFASSRPKARQIVNHGHILVNGEKVDIPSFQVKIGDVITIREKSKTSPLFKDLNQSLPSHHDRMPSWLALDDKAISGKVTGTPRLEDTEVGVDWQMIIEFYSK